MSDIATPIDTTPSPKSSSSDPTPSREEKTSAQPRRSVSPKRADISKADSVLKKLRLARGVTVTQIMELTGWRSHSVRGFLSAVVRKKLSLNLVSEIGKDGLRRYHITDDESKAD